MAVHNKRGGEIVNVNQELLKRPLSPGTWLGCSTYDRISTRDDRAQLGRPRATAGQSLKATGTASMWRSPGTGRRNGQFAVG